MPQPVHIRFNDEDDYEPSSSDDEYNENEKRLLKNLHQKEDKYSDSEEEVLGVASNDESDDDSDNLAASDIEGQEDDDDLPDIRAWGKNKRQYYSTDYVDPDYGGFQGKDAQLAEFEEEEARTLQKRLAEQLDDDDFCLDLLTKEVDEDEKQTEELIKTDISKLSKRQQLQIFKNESPEFFGLVEDFQVKMKIAQDFLNPVLVKYKKGQLSSCSAVEFVQTHYDLILNYCTNIYMYLLLKASKINLQNHPIIKRLFQYRELLSQLEPVYEEIIKPQLELLIEEDKLAKESSKKLSKILKKVQETEPTNKKKLKLSQEDKKPAKKVKFNESIEIKEIPFENDVNEEIETNSGELPADTNDNESNRRAITYQIAKNKGLTPHRKKEQRNPRVKHRNKFRKAKIRRKGAVREPRKELSRYGGEISGIKSSVTKSIKIKT